MVISSSAVSRPRRSSVTCAGKNRQIRRICAAVGLHVKRLRRVAEHMLTLGDLPVGKWRSLTAAEVAKINEG